MDTEFDLPIDAYPVALRPVPPDFDGERWYPSERAWWHGRTSGEAGYPLGACPHAPGDLAASWIAAWEIGQRSAEYGPAPVL